MDLTFGEKQEFKAGGGDVALTALERRCTEAAVEMLQELKADFETESASEAAHKAHLAEQEKNRIFEDTGIHPDFALFKED